MPGRRLCEPWSVMRRRPSLRRRMTYALQTLEPWVVTYRGVTRPEQAQRDMIRYWGTLLAPRHGYKSEKDRVGPATQGRVEALSRAASLAPSQRATVVPLAIVSVLRCTAGPLLSRYFCTWRDWHRGACPNSKTSRQCGVAGTAAHGGCPGPQAAPYSESPRAAGGKAVGAALRR
jgi:hypothetical protein